MWANTDFLFRGERMSATAKEIILNLRMISDVSDVNANINKIQQAMSKLNMPPELKQKFSGLFTDLEKETKNYQNLLNSGFKTKKDVTGLEASGKKINALMKSLETSMRQIDSSILEESFKVDPARLQGLNRELDQTKNKLSEIRTSEGFQNIVRDAEQATDAISKISKSKFSGEFLESVKKGDIQGAANALKQLEANHKQFKDSTKNEQYNEAFSRLQQVLSNLQGNTGLQETTQKINKLKSDIDNLNTSELDRFNQAFQDGVGEVNNMTSGVQNFVQANQEAAKSQQYTNSQLDQLKSRVGYFFSLT